MTSPNKDGFEDLEKEIAEICGWEFEYKGSADGLNHYVDRWDIDRTQDMLKILALHQQAVREAVANARIETKMRFAEGMESNGFEYTT